MKKNSRLYFLVILLIILVLILSKIFNFSSIKYNITYGNKKILISEKKSKKHTYIEINTGNHIYPITYFKNLKTNKKDINNVYYYKDNDIECVFPIISNEAPIDAMCYRDDIIYNYSDIKNTNDDLDKYIKSIPFYKIKRNDNIKYNKVLTVKYNKDKIDKTIALTTYRGLIVDQENIELFDNDIYSTEISAFVKNYYLVADYNNKYEFNNFYIVNLDTKKVEKLKSKKSISFDSYIQGIVDNKIYLYDKDNEIQYEIDPANKKINVVSRNNYIKYYKNNKWEKMNKIKAKKEILFDYASLDNKFPKYDEVKENSYYYYLFKKDGVSYKLYRVDKNNTSIKKYIITIPVNDIYVNDEYIYYIYKNKLYYYSDNTGLKILLENPELEFNNTIKYYIY